MRSTTIFTLLVASLIAKPINHAESGLLRRAATRQDGLVFADAEVANDGPASKVTSNGEDAVDVNANILNNRNNHKQDGGHGHGGKSRHHGDGILDIELLDELLGDDELVGDLIGLDDKEDILDVLELSGEDHDEGL
ncbi:hypothetical protein CONCODRAFT_6358, partial [Conidiobolus coronatus NRRL 28638]